jgi:outer membrane protein TolC
MDTVRLRKILISLIFFISFISAIARAEDIYLTIDEAIALALRQNKDVLLKAEDVKKAKLDIEEARAALYPAFNVTSTWSRNNGYYAKDFNTFNYQLGLKQYLYKGGKTVNNIKYNEYLLDVNQAILNKTKIETVLGVKKAFYTLLLSNRFADLNKMILKNTRQHLDFTQERYKHGLASESDVLKIRSSLDSVTQAYETSLNQIDSSQALLNSYLYLEKDLKVIPKGELFYKEEDIIYDEALLYALRNRPELKQYEAQEKADQKAIEVAKADNRPSIYASWDYYARSNAAAGTAKNWNDNNVIGITFSWPVFDGWATRSKIEQAIIDLKSTQITKEKAERDIWLEFRNAYLTLKNAIMKIDAMESDLKVYNDNLRSLKKMFKEGIASVLDMDDAILKYSISRFNKMQSVYDYVIAKSNFDKAMGEI